MTVARRATSVIVAGVLVGAIAGVALGVVWWRLAPRVPVVVRPDTVYPANYQPDGYIAADVAFAGLALVAGILVTVGLARMRREHLLSCLAAALLAGGIGSVLMWFVGTRLGHVDIEGLSATIADKVVVDAPLALSMPALMLVWPLTGAIVITVLAYADWWGEFRSRERSRR